MLLFRTAILRVCFFVGWRAQPKEPGGAIKGGAVDEDAVVFVWRTGAVDASFTIALSSVRSREKALESSESSDILIGVRICESIGSERGQVEGLRGLDLRAFHSFKALNSGSLVDQSVLQLMLIGEQVMP
jgi:hypothetical protein